MSPPFSSCYLLLPGVDDQDRVVPVVMLVQVGREVGGRWEGGEREVGGR